MSQEFPPLFLGLNAHGNPATIPLERHSLTIAGAGAGKGACQIIPNLAGPHAWQASTVVIDPAGEAAEASAVFRAKALGQKVAIFDPFGFCRGDDLKPYLTSFNVLDLVASSDDLHMIADGIVKRSAHETNPHWNDSATEVIAGLLAYLLEAPSIPDAERHLGNLRAILTLVQAKDEATLAEMRACTCFADLASQTARRCAKADNETANILSTVQTQTKWLTSEKMAAWLALPSAVDLHELKRGRLSVFLVIPPDKLKAQGQFLRLFVRAAVGVLQERMADGSRLGTRCLMILDEFYSLGRMGEMQEAAAQMRKFGLHLWPFLQDWGQLVELYGKEGSQAFTANCDAVCAFGIGDYETAEQFSKWLGTHPVDSAMSQFPITISVRQPENSLQTKRDLREKLFQDQSNFLREINMRRIGTPIIPPQHLRSELAKKDGEKVAGKMLVILKDHAIILRPKAYFEETSHSPGNSAKSFRAYFILIGIVAGIYPAIGAYMWSGSLETSAITHAIIAVIAIAGIWWEASRNAAKARST